MNSLVWGWALMILILMWARIIGFRKVAYSRMCSGICEILGYRVDKNKIRSMLCIVYIYNIFMICIYMDIYGKS